MKIFDRIGLIIGMGLIITFVFLIFKALVKYINS